MFWTSARGVRSATGATPEPSYRLSSRKRSKSPIHWKRLQAPFDAAPRTTSGRLSKSSFALNAVTIRSCLRKLAEQRRGGLLDRPLLPAQSWCPNH